MSTHDDPTRLTIRGPLFDDPVSPRLITPLAALIATLARADRVTLDDDLSQAQAERAVYRIFVLFVTWCAGLVIGWILWG